MTDDSRTPLGQEHLSDAFLWLVGTPLAFLDSLYLTRLAPPLEPEHPETLVVWILGVLALFLLIWSLLSSACAHLALLRGAPPAVRRVAHALVARCGTRLARSMLARAGASALIGSALVSTAPVAASIAAPQERSAPGLSLTPLRAHPGAAARLTGFFRHTGIDLPRFDHSRAGRFPLVDCRVPASRS